MVVPIVRLVEESKYSKRLCCLWCSRTLSACHFLFLLLFHACRQCLRATCQKLLLSSLIGRNTAGLITQPEAESKSWKKKGKEKKDQVWLCDIKEPAMVVTSDSQTYPDALCVCMCVRMCVCPVDIKCHPHPNLSHCVLETRAMLRYKSQWFSLCYKGTANSVSIQFAQSGRQPCYYPFAVSLISFSCFLCPRPSC